MAIMTARVAVVQGAHSMGAPPYTLVLFNRM
jgi:hypothetical protein